jgi:diguanylate cyclase (GGDEF)-like protein
VERTIARAYEELGSYHFEHRVVWPDRSVHVLECHGHVEADADGTVLRMFGTAQDVSQRKRQTAELERLARQDPLTGLENHRVFHEQLRREVSRARRETRPLALAVLDLDHFKAINDTHGHPQGDAVLREIARRLQAQTRDGECLARIGGEEFGWILPGADATGALSAAERARAAIAEEPFDGVGRLTMSVGVCELTSGISARELHRRADLALLEAKRAGRDCTVRHAPGAQRIASAA